MNIDVPALSNLITDGLISIVVGVVLAFFTARLKEQRKTDLERKKKLEEFRRELYGGERPPANVNEAVRRFQKEEKEKTLANHITNFSLFLTFTFLIGSAIFILLQLFSFNYDNPAYIIEPTTKPITPGLLRTIQPSNTPTAAQIMAQTTIPTITPTVHINSKSLNLDDIAKPVVVGESYDITQSQNIDCRTDAYCYQITRRRLSNETAYIEWVPKGCSPGECTLNLLQAGGFHRITGVTLFVKSKVGGESLEFRVDTNEGGINLFLYKLGTGWVQDEYNLMDSLVEGDDVEAFRIYISPLLDLDVNTIYIDDIKIWGY